MIEYNVMSETNYVVFSDNYCLDTMGKTSHGSTVGIYPCHGEGGNQNWITSDKNDLKNDNACLCADGSRTNLLLTFCSAHSECSWNFSGHRVRMMNENKCFTRSADNTQMLLEECQDRSSQYWEFVSQLNSP